MKRANVVQRKGVIDEEGRIIVPIEYEEIIQLDCGVYIAKVSTIDIKDDKPVRKQYYHHKQLIPIKDKSKYHLYTEKGKVIFSEPIMSYYFDIYDNDKITKVEGLNNRWIPVRLDYENNVLRIISE